MCARPDPFEYVRDISRVIEVLREDTTALSPYHDCPWAGARLYYGLLENV